MWNTFTRWETNTDLSVIIEWHKEGDISVANDCIFLIERDEILNHQFVCTVCLCDLYKHVCVVFKRVIGLYVSLVLVIGRFVRMWIQGLSFKIMFVELPNPDVLLKLCLDIYMVRESGELMLEEELFAQLIFLYRSPETLIKVTKHAKSDWRNIFFCIKKAELF